MSVTKRWLGLVVAACMGTLLVLAAVVAGAGARSTAPEFGAFGPQGPRMREQLWLLPSADRHIPLRATVFRPSDDAPMPKGVVASSGRRPLVVINHGTSEWTRHAVAMPVYYWLSRWFVDRGYVVVLPQRRGHGATGGELVEARGNCADPDHYTSGLVAAEDIAAAIGFMSEQPFIAPSETIAVGISSGGWASLALASRSDVGLRAVVSFAGGRGAHAFGRPHAICAPSRLVDAAARYAASARAPSLWLYAENDSYFGPDIARAMHTSWTDAGGVADLHVFPKYGTEGHALADDQNGWYLWGGALQAFLERAPQPEPTKAPMKAVSAGWRLPW